MAETKIEWTRSPNGDAGYTFNGWEGCQKAGPGCDHCYAETRNHRFAGGENWGPGAPRRRTSVKNWNLPKRWNREAKAKGTRLRVFTASLSDWLDNAVDIEWLADLLFQVMETDGLDWLMLTKRIGIWHSRLAACHDVASTPEGIKRWPGLAGWVRNWLDGKAPAHVFIGATIVNQEEADRDTPKLLAVPAAKRFLSMEPLLGPVDLHLDRLGEWNRLLAQHHRDEDGVKIDWVIVGGESGPGARPMHPDWVRSLRDQSVTAGVAFLFKQWGEWLPGQNEEHPHANGRKVAHHQDGSWGETDTKVNATNYVAWAEDGTVRHGSLLNDTSGFRVHAWAERIGKQAAGRLLDARIWDEVPA